MVGKTICYALHLLQSRPLMNCLKSLFGRFRPADRSGGLTMPGLAGWLLNGTKPVATAITIHRNVIHCGS
jgi:hypothetical protein